MKTYLILLITSIYLSQNTTAANTQPQPGSPTPKTPTNQAQTQPQPQTQPQTYVSTNTAYYDPTQPIVNQLVVSNQPGQPGSSQLYNTMAVSSESNKSNTYYDPTKPKVQPSILLSTSDMIPAMCNSPCSAGGVECVKCRCANVCGSCPSCSNCVNCYLTYAGSSTAVSSANGVQSIAVNRNYNQNTMTNSYNAYNAYKSPTQTIPTLSSSSNQNQGYYYQPQPQVQVQSTGVQQEMFSNYSGIAPACSNVCQRMKQLIEPQTVAQLQPQPQPQVQQVQQVQQYTPCVQCQCKAVCTPCNFTCNECVQCFSYYSGFVNNSNGTFLMDKNGNTVKYKTLKNIVPNLFKTGNSLPLPLPKLNVNVNGNGLNGNYSVNLGGSSLTCYSPNQSFNCVCAGINSKTSCVTNPTCSWGVTVMNTNGC